MKKPLLCAALVLPLFLSGCVISVGGDGMDGHVYTSSTEEREFNNRQHIADLQLNAHYEAVTRTMGVADFDELIDDGDHLYRILYYRTQRAIEDGMTTKEECTPLVFKDDRLVGWGASALAKI